MFDEYPELTPEFLSQYTPLEIDEEYYTVETILQQRPEKNAFVTSLFCANPDSLYPNYYPPPNSDPGGVWWNRYVGRLCTTMKFMDTNPKFQDWKFRIYLDPSLQALIPVLTECTPRLELYIMKRSSVGHNPGATWRLMALEDKTIETGYVFDSDEILDNLLYLGFLDAFVGNPKMGVGRLLEESVGKCEWRDSPVYIYTTMCCGLLGFRPALLDLPIRDCILRYIAYRKAMAVTDRPWEYPGMTEPSPYTGPTPGTSHIWGWGNHWYIYGWDERVLKHIVFPRAVRKGILQSWHIRPYETYLVIHPAINKDIFYTKSFPGNEYVRIHGPWDADILPK